MVSSPFLDPGTKMHCSYVPASGRKILVLVFSWKESDQGLVCRD